MCVDGNAIIEAGGFSEALEIGETILIPASIATIQIKATAATILEVYIPYYTLN
jgi:mannose-6-phosphate isomerase class I